MLSPASVPSDFLKIIETKRTKRISKESVRMLANLPGKQYFGACNQKALHYANHQWKNSRKD